MLLQLITSSHLIPNRLIVLISSTQYNVNLIFSRQHVLEDLTDVFSSQYSYGARPMNYMLNFSKLNFSRLIQTSYFAKVIIFASECHEEDFNPTVDQQVGRSRYSSILFTFVSFLSIHFFFFHFFTVLHQSTALVVPFGPFRAKFSNRVFKIISIRRFGISFIPSA